MKTPIHPLILCGGQSSRLFPFNKVLSDLNASGRSLIQQSWDRAKALAPAANVHVLTVPAMGALIRRVIPIAAARCLSDPARRGTGPAILWAMAHLKLRPGDPVMAVLTADHVIPQEKAFLKLARQALARAVETPAIVLLGVKPSADPSAWLGFGCFQVKQGKVLAFEEKPSKPRAQAMIREGGWFWNSGMFFFRLSVAEEALRHFQPELFYTYLKVAERLKAKDPKGAAQAYEEFPAQIPHPREAHRLVDNSIDYALMTPLVLSPQPTVRAEALETPIPRWFDIGRWDALRGLLRADRRGNIALGEAKIGPRARDCILAADQGCQVDVDGVQGFIAACSNGKALVMPVRDLETIKTLVAEAKGPLVSSSTQALDIQWEKNRLVVRPKR